MENTEELIAEYEKLLKYRDWYYHYSDDHSVFMSGERQMARSRYLHAKLTDLGYEALLTNLCSFLVNFKLYVFMLSPPLLLSLLVHNIYLVYLFRTGRTTRHNDFLLIRFCIYHNNSCFHLRIHFFHRINRGYPID